MKIRDRLPLLAVLCCFSALLLLPEVSAGETVSLVLPEVVELAALYYQQDKQSEDGGYASRSYTEGQVTQSDSYLTPSQLKQAEAEVLERIARYRRVSC